ncbi:MAG: YceI family protein [Pseudomonadota bacterium]
MSTSAMAERWVTYVIDPQATRINFHWTYMGLLSPIGQFSDATGTIVCDLDKPDAVRVDVRIPVRTLKTFMPLIDRTLLDSGDYFQPEQHPFMRFRSSEIMHLEKDKREFSLLGELTVNGITRPVILSAKVPVSNQGNPLSSGALSATTSFRRSDFGMNKMLGVVGDEMRIILQVRAEAVPAVASE